MPAEISPEWQAAIDAHQCCPRCLMYAEATPCLSENCPLIPDPRTRKPPQLSHTLGGQPDKNFAPAPRTFKDILDVPEEIAEELDRVFGEEPGTKEHRLAPKPTHRPPLGQDMVVLPKHYARFEIEPIRFIASNKLDFLAANIIKYTCRAEFKHSDKGLEDSLKVIRYAVMRAKFLQGDPDWWKAYRNPDIHRLIQEEITCGPQSQGRPDTSPVA